MKRISLLLAAGILACCAPKKDGVKISKSPGAFAKTLDTYYEEFLKINPFEATIINDNRYNNLLLNDISESYRNEIRQFCQKYKDSLSAYDRASLSPQEQISYDVLNYELDMRQSLLSYPDNLMPVQQFSCLTLTMPQMGSGQGFQPFKTAKDYDDFLGRVDGFAIWMDTAIANMRKGLAQGYTYPKILMERVLPQCQDMMVKDVKQSIFYMPIASMPDSINAADKTRLTDAYTKMINDKIVPAYTKLHNFIKDEYIPKTRTTSGIGDIPNGKEYYQKMIKNYTTTDLTADSVFNLGLSEVARIRAEMEKVKEQVGFKGDLKAFFKYVKEDKKFTPYTKAEQVIADYKAIEQKIQPKLKTMFNMVPKMAFEVRQTEAFRAASASAEYNAGAPDGSRPGIFYVPILDPKKSNVSRMETLFLHEAIPGHHYQIALQMENKDLPRFRRTLGYGSYAEGWGLYAESLGKDLGLFTDPIKYFGHLSAEMHRSIRLVVDAGIHTKGWTREKAIEYMLDNELISDQAATAEIERYMAIPGQALSYKVGQLKIKGLREYAQKELGDKFNIGLFHDEVLKYGSLPLNILEQRIQEWVSKMKTAS